jgi:hypothetical protein
MPPYPKKNTADDETSTVTTCLTSDSSSTNSSRASQRTVRFSLESNQIFPITHRDDMDVDDIYETWYECPDLTAIKTEIISTLRKMIKEGKVEETNQQTLRGLECRTRQGSLRRRKNKELAVSAVLNAQILQRDDGEQDEEALAEAYCNASSAHCREEAYAVGLKDEAEIKTELLEMRAKGSWVTSTTVTSTVKKSHKKSKSLGIHGLLKHVGLLRGRPLEGTIAKKSAVVGTAA